MVDVRKRDQLLYLWTSVDEIGGVEKTSFQCTAETILQVQVMPLKPLGFYFHVCRIAGFGDLLDLLQSCYIVGNLNLANPIAECKESKACSPAKHHFDECVERVTGADQGKPVDKKHPEEDCVEECKS